MIGQVGMFKNRYFHLAVGQRKDDVKMCLEKSKIHAAGEYSDWYFDHVLIVVTPSTEKFYSNLSINFLFSLVLSTQNGERIKNKSNSL